MDMALTERFQNNVDATHWKGAIPMNYIYTAGRAQEPFFQALRDKGEFLGARCEACGIVLVPPQMYCERCFADIDGAAVKLPNEGVVHSFTVCHETYDDRPKAEPSVVAFIKIDGAEGGILHRLDVDPLEACIGMVVKARFKPKKERTGSILDIECFEPA